MSKHLAELCTLLVRDTYGELPARIISTLFLHGRLTITPLSHLSNLPLRYVKHGLAILIQHSLLYHITTAADGQTYYEINVRSIYDIVRCGKYVRLVDERLGEDAAALLSLLEYSGYVNAAEILDFNSDAANSEAPITSSAYSNGKKMAHRTTANGTHGEGTTTICDRMETCKHLFSTRHVVEVTDLNFMAPSDFQEAVENYVTIAEFGGEVKGTKMAKEFRLAVLKRKAEWLEDNTATVWRLEEGAKQARLHADRTQNVRKRLDSPEPQHTFTPSEQVDGTSERRPNKKRKLTEHEPNGVVNDFDIASRYPLGEGDVGRNSRNPHKSEHHIPSFCINREKFDVSLRSQRLVGLAARFLGQPAAEIYSTLLRRLEHNIPRCHDEYVEAFQEAANQQDRDGEDLENDGDDENNPSATCAELEKELDPTLDLHFSFAVDKNAKIKVEYPYENGISHDDASEPTYPDVSRRSHETSTQLIQRQKRTNAIDQHLRLLSEHSFQFCTRISGRGSGTWTVDFRRLTHALIQFELEAVITARFGPLASRLVRILHSKGKLDEKQLGSIGLMRQKDLRRALMLMQETGFIDTQEVPRDNTRQPNRTIYLWFYDQERCRKLILNDSYKAMTRLLQRVKVEQEKVQSVIDKAERTDVKGNESMYLAPAEQEALQEWRGTEEKLLVQLSRQDDLVALLRDFVPLGL